MGEAVSKTAKQAMQAGQNREAKKDPFDTDEKKISELRKQRNPGFPLAVNRYDFIDALLRQYDLQAKELAEYKTANMVINAANRTNDEYIKKLKAQVESLRAAVLTATPGQQEHTEILREIEQA